MGDKLTSRERVLLSLNHEEPDRIPIDLGSARSTGINAIAYRDLLQYLQLNSDVKVFDVKQLLAIPGQNILERFGCDVVMLHGIRPSLGLSLDEWKEGRLPVDGGRCLVPAGFNPVMQSDGSEAIFDCAGHLLAKRPKDGLYFDEFYHPLEEAVSREEVDMLPMPEISDDELAYLSRRAKELYEKTDYAISGATSFSLFEKGTKDFGYETFLTNLYTEPELVEYYLDKLTAAYIVWMEKYLDAVGDYIQIVQNNDDLGMQQGMIISPELYRRFFKPRHEKIIKAIKNKKKGVFVFLHSCGSIYPVMNDLIEAGFEIFNPVQYNAADMDPQRLKKEFGRKCTFWGGGVDTQNTLAYGTADDVAAEAKKMIQIFSPGGGFIFNAVHNIQAGVAPDKIVALYDTAKKYGVADFYKGEN